MIDVVELLVHWHAGRRIGELSASLGIDPKTVRKYTAPALAAGLAPGTPALTHEQWATLVEGWFPELVDHSAGRTSWPEIEAHRERISSWVGTVTVSTIHQRLRDDHGLAVSESSLRRYVQANFNGVANPEAVRVLRDTPPPGEEAQVDYGLLGRWVDPVTGRARRVWGFLMVLVYSRMLFLRPVLRMDQASWVESHVLAFEFFHGSVARVVPDNLKTGVIRPDLYDPKVNRAFGEFALHYGTLIDPARAGKPRDKAWATDCTSWLNECEDVVSGRSITGCASPAPILPRGAGPRRRRSGRRHSSTCGAGPVQPSREPACRSGCRGSW